MTYVDGIIAAVPSANKQAYLDFAEAAWPVFKDVGALEQIENWADDVPDGESTDLKKAVKLEDGEVVVFSWLLWPSKEIRDAGWAKVMQDERMQALKMPFDGKRMIFGGFDTIFHQRG